MKTTSVAFFLLLSLGCARELPLEGAACPCASGWVCCESQPVCARSVDACPAPTPLTVVPGSATVASGRRLRFVAEGADAWRVEEPAGGAIDADGLYTAPEVPGVYHVVASAPGGREARAEVTVRELRVDVLVGQAGGPSDGPVDGVGGAARFSSPRGMVMDEEAVYVVDLPTSGLTSLDDMWPVSSVRRIDRRTGAVETLVRGSAMAALSTGNDSWALSDGPLESATFSRPRALALDPRGRRLFIAELCLVRELDLSTRVVRTVAGTPTFASYDALTSCSRTQRIDALSTDGADRLFATRSMHHVIEELRISTGEARVVAGKFDQQGSDDGSDGGLRWPAAVVFDRDVHEGERLFVADQNGQVMRSVWLDYRGALETLVTSRWGSFIGVAAQPGVDRFAITDTGVLLSRLDKGSTYEWAALAGPRAPGGLAVSAERELWTGDRETGVIYRRLDGQTTASIVAGKLGGQAGIQDGLGAAAQLTVPFGSGALTVSSDGAAWLTDPSNQLIRRISPSGEVTTPFRDVVPEAIAADGAHLYMLENGRLMRAPRTGGPWELVAGRPRVIGVQSEDGIGAAASFGETYDLVSDGHGTLWVAEVNVASGFTYKLRRVRLADGAVSTLFTTSDYRQGPTALAFDGDQTLFLLVGSRIDAFEVATGARRTLFEDPQPGRGLRDLACDGGKLYATRLDGAVVLQIDAVTGGLHTLVGQPGGAAVVPGPLRSARLHQPASLAVLPSGDLLVADDREHVLVLVH
ncbi:MAG: hypothetical protein ACOZQL_01020 [Myxococcota bacterium]